MDESSMIQNLYGIRVQLVDESFVRIYKKKQFRFPKSKKKRIRKKWSKRLENFHTVIVPGERAMKVGEILYVGPKTYEAMKKLYGSPQRK